MAINFDCFFDGPNGDTVGMVFIIQGRALKFQKKIQIKIVKINTLYYCITHSSN